MVERYNTYCTWAHNRSTGKQICPDGEHVSATDYAALEAERDEWERRCEAMCALASDCDPSLNTYYLVACKCGWKGSSCECNGGTPLADTGDYNDVTCPACGCVDPTDM